MDRVIACLNGEHDWKLVLLAGVVCLLASLVAVSLFHRSRLAPGRMRVTWLLLAGIAAGCGIWATHFIGMLAYQPGVAVAYNIGLTALSLVSAVFVTSAGLVAAALPWRWAAPAGGAAVGVGVALMHYMGMAALELPGRIEWHADLVAASIGAGIILAAAAMAVAARGETLRATFAAAVLLTLAILAHHFIAMGAMQIVLDPKLTINPFTFDNRTLAMAVAGIALAVLGMSLVGAVADHHLVARSEKFDDVQRQLIAASEEKLRAHNMWLDAALNNMTQGLCMFDANERVVVLNRRFLEMYQLSPQVVRPGCTLIELLRHRREVGLLEADPDSYYVELKRELALGVTTHRTLRIKGNRFILAYNQPMPGGGWVTTHEDITERRQAEDQVREEKRKLDAALNNMSQGLCMFDATGRIIICNERYLQMYDLRPEDVEPGRSLWDLIRLRKQRGVYSGPDDPDRYIEGLTAALAKGQGVDFTIEVTGGRIMAVANRPLPDGRWVATHEDITERQRSRIRLNEQRLQLDAALNNMSQGLCMFDAEARLIICNQRYLDMYGMKPEEVPAGIPLVELLEKRRAQGTWARDPNDYLAELRGMLAKGQSVTFTVEGPAGRVISIFNRPLPDGRWVSCHEDITERRNTERTVAEQKLKLDAALDNMTHGLCMFDSEGRVLVFNPRYAEMMGVSPDFLRDCTFLELMRERKAAGQLIGDPEALTANVLDSMKLGRGDSRVVERGDGRVHNVVRQPMPGGGWVATLEDITERRIAQERLREQKLQLDTALSNMSQGLCMFNAEGRVVLFNRRYSEIVGFSAESLRDLSFAELLARRKAAGDFAGDPAEYSQTVFNSIRQGKTITRISRLGDGRVHRIVVQPMATGGWVSTIEDISEQQRAETLMAEQKIQLDTALNNMSQGLNMFDADGRLVVCNERYLKMYRLSPDQVKPGATVAQMVQARVANGTFFAVDAERYIADLLDHIRNKRTPNAGEMETADGRVIATFSQPTPNGGWVVTHEDITERRSAEQERDRSQALASAVIENVPSTIVVKDARTLQYVLVNRAGEAYFGAQRENMIGKTSDEVFDPETAATIAEHDHTLLRTGQPQFYDEHPTRTPGAGSRIVTTMRTPIRDKQGDLAYLLTVIEDRTNRKRAEATIAHMAHHDALTGLPNRSAFNMCLTSTIEQAARDGTSFALMSIDIDRFKEANDVLGHVVGDDLLCEVSRRLMAASGGAFVARLGGDEFVLISTEGEQPPSAQHLADQILSAIGREFEIHGHQVRLGISIGVAIFPADGNDAETLVANADAALYRAKSEGRGIYRFFEAGMDRRLRERRALQHDLHSAIERGELTLNYQPQARIGGEIIGFEALVRWKHPARGNVSPGEFIPLAEESGLIVPMGEWILREACREAASWAKPLTIGINMSPVQFRHGDLPALVHGILLETGLAPSRLELEITEGVLIDDFSRAVSILRRLKALGVRIAMDDFGTGYSSLSYLQSFPFDKIKIDRAFISNMESSPQSATIVRTVIALARGLNLPVLAEGVETKSQLNFLTKESCDEVQGYLIGRPMPIADYAALVQAQPAPSKKTRAAAG
jgi:diguanylate cyclase (GGDEF)-like protein/PAS domain S-box-containing protein